MSPSNHPNQNFPWCSLSGRLVSLLLSPYYIPNRLVSREGLRCPYEIMNLLIRLKLNDGRGIRRIWTYIRITQSKTLQDFSLILQGYWWFFVLFRELWKAYGVNNYPTVTWCLTFLWCPLDTVEFWNKTRMMTAHKTGSARLRMLRRSLFG